MYDLPLFSSSLLFCNRGGLGEGVTDKGVSKLTSQGCGMILKSLTLACECLSSLCCI